jgi:Zinc-binding dehydrogenase
MSLVVLAPAYGGPEVLTVTDETVGEPGPGADPGTEIRQAARLDLVRLAAAGRLRVIVGQTFPLAEVAAAHRLSLTGHARGKIALIP